MSRTNIFRVALSVTLDIREYEPQCMLGRDAATAAIANVERLQSMLEPGISLQAIDLIAVAPKQHNFDSLEEF